MNYLKLILRFWKLRRSKRITSLQADLYFYLIQECNERDWENPFECANKLICGSINISEPSLIDARNRLQQLGLISFKSGKRNECSPVYFIEDSESNLNNLSRNQVNTLVEPLDETEIKGQPIKEQTKRKPKPKQNSKSHSSPDGDVEKKVTEYWERLVENWFLFYEEKFKVKPIFNAVNGEHLKKIIAHLKKTTQKDWTEEYAIHCLKRFLTAAWQHNDWFKNNFELKNLLSNFNAITNSKHNESIQNSNNRTNTEAILGSNKEQSSYAGGF